MFGSISHTVFPEAEQRGVALRVEKLPCHGEGEEPDQQWVAEADVEVGSDETENVRRYQSGAHVLPGQQRQGARLWPMPRGRRGDVPFGDGAPLIDRRSPQTQGPPGLYAAVPRACVDRCRSRADFTRVAALPNGSSRQARHDHDVARRARLICQAARGHGATITPNAHNVCC
jgi:hypothetical protein